MVFILFIFYFNFHILDLFLSNSLCCQWRPHAIKFGADYMSSYFFRHCLVFSVMTMCRFLGIADLSAGALANAFICSQWERKETLTDVYIAV